MLHANKQAQVLTFRTMFRWINTNAVSDRPIAASMQNVTMRREGACIVEFLEEFIRVLNMDMDCAFLIFFLQRWR